MGLFWFIVIIVVVIILVRKKNANTSDEYQQGYYDGYKALSEKIWHELDQPRLNHDAVKSMLIERQLQGEAVSEFESALGDSESEDTLGVAYDESGYQPYDDDVKIAAAGVTQVSRSAPEAVSPEVTSLRNLNIILYVASFLLVAAGALFIGAAVPDGVKLIGVWAIVGVFYGAGYVLHRMVARLQPAAVAFLGTGLALIPFAGFALNQYGVMNPDIVWIITSVVGVAAYMAAAVRLQSQLVSYLTVAFALSLVSSSSVSLEMSLVWQFVVFIGVSLVASLIAMVKPQWVPSVFGRPIERMGQFLTPIVLVASLFAGDQIKLAGYEILFTVSTMYYVIVWLQTRSPAYEVVVRIVASLTLTVFAFDIFDGFGSAFALSILMIAALQILYSLYVVDRPDRQGVEYRWITFMTALQLIALLTWVGGGQKEAMYGLIGLLFVGIMNIAVVLRI
ncbi:MAG: hypothetical protein ABIR91_03195, partial [Candidatus Saccharimonadales bacterium]